MRLAAVLRKDLLHSGRSAAFFWVRFAYAGLAAVWIGLPFLLRLLDGVAFSIEQIRQLAGMSFGSWCIAQAVGVVPLVLFSGFGEAEREIRLRTLPLVAMSRIHAWEFVIGKVLSDATVFLGICASALPTLILVAWFGGLDPRNAAEVLLLTAAIGLVAHAIGLAFGLLRRARKARIVLGFGLSALLILCFSWSPLTKTTESWNPMFALAEAAFQVPAAARRASLGSSLLFCGALFLVFLQLAVWRVPAAAQVGEGPATVRGRRLGRRPVRGNPVAWFGAQVGPPLHPALALALGVGLLLMGALSWGLGVRSVPSFLTVAAFSGVLYGLPVLLLARALPRQREEGSLKILAATPLTNGDILRGTLRSGLWSLTLCCALPAVAWMFYLGIDGNLGWRGLGLAGLHMLINALLGLMLGFAFSLHATRPGRVGAFAGLALLFLYVIGLAAFAAGISTGEGDNGLLLLLLFVFLPIVILVMSAIRSGRRELSLWALILGFGTMVPYVLGFFGWVVADIFEDLFRGGNGRSIAAGGVLLLCAYLGTWTAVLVLWSSRRIGRAIGRAA